LRESPSPLTKLIMDVPRSCEYCRKEVIFREPCQSGCEYDCDNGIWLGNAFEGTGLVGLGKYDLGITGWSALMACWGNQCHPGFPPFNRIRFIAKCEPEDIAALNASIGTGLMLCFNAPCAENIAGAAVGISASFILPISFGKGTAKPLIDYNHYTETHCLMLTIGPGKGGYIGQETCTARALGW